MIKPVFHFFKIHRKMILGNTAVIIQNMFGKTPKSFNAVNVIFSLLVHHVFRMVYFVMLTKTFQRIVAPKGVRIVYRSLSCLLPNNSHQFFLRDMLHNPRIDLSIAFQQAKYYVFALCASSALTFASATEIALIHFYATIQFTTFQFRYMIYRFSELLIYTGDCLIIYSQIMRETIRRLLLIESLYNGNFRTNFLQRLLFSTGLIPASNIPTMSLRNFEGATENTLFSSQKVGRATKNVLLTCNHKGILTPLGYETH